MARQILPLVGQVVGGMVGGPWGAAIGGALGAWAGNAIDPQVIHGPQLGEGQNNTASEGGYRPIVLGTGAVGVCMLHEGPLIPRTIRHRQSKGGGPITTEQRHYRTMAFGLGESADPFKGVALLRLWVDNVLVYDVRPQSEIPAESAEYAERFTFYPGDQEQLPDPDIEAFMGAGNVPAYRGRPYIVFPEYDVTRSSGRAPVIRAELAMSSEIATKALIYVSPDIEAGVLIVSEDGDTFPASEDTGLGAQITRMHAVGSAIYVFNGETGLVRLRPGSAWQSVSGFTGANQVNAITSANGVFAAVGQSGPIRISNDGVNFVPTSTLSRTRYCIAAKGNTFVSGGSLGTVTVSFDNGSTWSEHQCNPPSTSNVTAIVATESVFIATQNSNHQVSVSASGAEGSWTQHNHPFIGGAPTNAVSLGHKDGVVTMRVSSSMAYSVNNAATWTTAGDTAYNDVQSEHASNAAGIFVNGSGASPNPTLWRSVDGTAWLPSSDLGRSGPVVATDAATIPSIVGEPIPLSTIVQWIHHRAGSDRFNDSELTDMVEGIVFADGYNASDALRSLMALYFFDVGEFDAGSGYRLNYVKRGKPAVLTLTADDIVEGPEEWRREDSFERPKQLHVAYANPIADYNSPQVTIKRTSPDVRVTGERSVSVPVTFSDVDEITQRADIMMTVLYVEIAGEYEIVLPDSLLELAPTDNIGFSIRGRTRRLRMTKWAYTEGTIKAEWIADRQSAITSNVTGLPVVPSRPPPPSIVGPTVSAVLDIPALVDSLDTLHLVVAASGQTPAWYGAEHQRRMETETDFTPALRITAPTTIMGALQDAVSSASPHYTDTTNRVRVMLYSDDELETHTQQQFLSEHGAFALCWDDSGTRRWELCQYRDAVKVGEREWELSTLLRGRLDTNAAEHPEGSLFVLLDAGIRAMPAQASWIGQDITHRAVSLGQNQEQAVPYAEAYTGQSQREWPVAHILSDGIEGGSLPIRIVPRHRFGTDDQPMRSVNWQGYRITATDGSNTTTVETLSDTHTLDVSGWATTVTVTVAQLNRITGAGPVVSEEIE